MKLSLKPLPNKAVTPDLRGRWVRPDTEAEKAANLARRQEYDAAEAAWMKDNAHKYPGEFEAHSMFAAEHRQCEYRKQGKAAALVALDWVWHTENWLFRGLHSPAPMEAMPTAASITLPLALDGEGRDFVNVRIESRKVKHSDLIGNVDANGNLTWMEKECEIEGRIGGEMFRGLLIVDPITEMTAFIVVIHGLARQDLADRLAKAMRPAVLAYVPEELPLVLKPSEHCFACNRPLNDTVSRVLMIGPNCAEKLGVRHDHAAAQDIVSRKAAFWAKAAEA